MKEQERKQRVEKVAKRLIKLQEKNELQNLTADFLSDEAEKLVNIAENESVTAEERYRAIQSAGVILRKMQLEMDDIHRDQDILKELSDELTLIMRSDSDR